LSVLPLLLAVCGLGPGNGRIAVTVTVPEDPAAAIRVVYEGRFHPAPIRTVRAAPAVVGAYERFPFGRFVRNLEARDEHGRRLSVSPAGEGVWTVAGPLARLSYEVDAAAGEREISDFLASTHRRDGFTRLSGTATFLLVEGVGGKSFDVTVEAPDGWRVATGHNWNPLRGAFSAGQLSLLDEPIAVGTRFVSGIARHGETVSHVHVYADPPARAEDFLQRFVEAQEKALAAAAALELPVPFGRALYHVFIEIVRPVEGRELGWALEHERSFQGAFALDDVPADPDRLAYHFTHHVFHTWIPRRLFTDRLDPFRLLEGEPSEFVWFAEGFAQYLAFVGLAKAGVFEPKTALERLEQRFVPPYRENAPPEPRSMTAHSRALSAGEKTHWRYGYAQGGLLALWLEEKLHAMGPDSPSLSQVLWRIFDREDGADLREDEFESFFREASGLDVTEIFRCHVRGAEPLPVEEILAGAKALERTVFQKR